MARYCDDISARNLIQKLQMERPNTVAGLKAKRAELAKLHEALEAEVRKVTCDLDHANAISGLLP